MAEKYIIEHGLDEAPTFLGASAVYRLLDLDELINAIETALVRFSAGPSGGVVMPVRTVLPVGKSSSFLSMPGYSEKDNSLAVKLVSVFPENEKKNLHSHMATLVLFDAETGQTKALMDGLVITAMRTAAVSAIAVRNTIQKKSGCILAVIGSGLQARSHVLAMRRVCEFSEVRIWSRTPANARHCADDIGGVAVESAEAAVRGADVIVTVSFPSDVPILQGDWVKPGAIVTAVGAFRLNQREMDETLMHNAVVLVDSREAVAKESGDIVSTGVSVHAEIGEVVAGTAKPIPAGSTVVFKSLGLAIEDVISAKLVYDKYLSSRPPSQ